MAAGALSSLGLATSLPASPSPAPLPSPGWRRGLDDQRIADLGDGRFLNPVLSGDRPDPAILKDGADYYLTFSSFESYPGLLIWHSRDLVNWQPRKPALTRNIGSVWAVSLEKHKGRYFLYIPVKASPQNDIYVIWADHIDGRGATPCRSACTSISTPAMRWARTDRAGCSSRAATGCGCPMTGCASPARSSMSTTPGAIRTNGMSRASRPRGRRSTILANGST